MDAAMATALASIVVALIGGAFTYASLKASNKASKSNNSESLESKRLEQAYERARKFDIETIERQDEEIEILRGEKDVLEGQVAGLKARVLVLELQLGITPPKENT